MDENIHKTAGDECNSENYVEYYTDDFMSQKEWEDNKSNFFKIKQKLADSIKEYYSMIKNVPHIDVRKNKKDNDIVKYIREVQFYLKEFEAQFNRLNKFQLLLALHEGNILTVLPGEFLSTLKSGDLQCIMIVPYQSF